MKDIYIKPSQKIIIYGMDLMELLDTVKNDDEEGLKLLLDELGIKYV